jgi:Fe-S-cluster-containing hydrogenase component 2
VGKFKPSIASIEIIERWGGKGIGISIYREPSNSHLSCDQCEGLEEKMCVKYCPVIGREELGEILNKEV